MMPDICSILMITIDRYEITKNVLRHNLDASGYPNIELLVCDNGSSDKRIIEEVASYKPRYHRINSKNEGVSHAFNQLFLRSSGKYIVLMGNDIKMPGGWLEEAIDYADAVPNSGIIGFNWGHSGVPPIQHKFGYNAHYLKSTGDRVFGTWVMRREVIDQVGLFDEAFGNYGLEDSCMNERVNRAGFNSFYLPNMKSEHICNDVGQKTEYRMMKDKSMAQNQVILGKSIEAYNAGGSIRKPLPAIKDSI